MYRSYVYTYSVCYLIKKCNILVYKYTEVNAIHVLYVTYSTNVIQISKYTEVMAIPVLCVT